MKLDIKKWNEARRELEKNIKEYKGRRTESMQPRWGSFDDVALRDMKWEATTLYAVRAAVRGIQHCPSWTIQDAIDRILPQFLVPTEEKPATLVIS